MAKKAQVSTIPAHLTPGRSKNATFNTITLRKLVGQPAYLRGGFIRVPRGGWCLVVSRSLYRNDLPDTRARCGLE